MNGISNLKNALLHLFYPHICAGCGTHALAANSQLCVQCLHELPATGFENHPGNPVEARLSGRIRFEQATAQYYFAKKSFMQDVMHAFKYHGNRELGLQLGRLMGHSLQQSHRFDKVDLLIPLPLHDRRERQRGFNQSTIICKGISEVLQIPVITDAVVRHTITETQTKKNRAARWQNMEGKFAVVDKHVLSGKHVLLVDDVITTGSTLESCGTAMLAVEDVKLSIATLCFAATNRA
ncbi:MAG: ComF family protein [Niabella sp.]